MAGEFKLTVAHNITKGYYKDSYSPGQFSIDQATQGAFTGVLAIGTSEEAITFTDIGTLGWLTMHNLDTTNYVDWGPDSGGSMVAVGRMKANEVAVFRLKPGITLRLQANTASCKVLFKCYND